MTNPKQTMENNKIQALESLNQAFGPLGFEARIQTFYQLFAAEQVLVTSSFGTTSAMLLHLISRYNARQKIHFIDTGYHFAETLTYKKQLARELGLAVVDIQPEATAHAQTRQAQLWREDPDRCCQINKVAPLNQVKAQYQVWMSGLMGYQTDFRAEQRIFERSGHLLKFHPLIDLEEAEFLYYKGYHQLPEHPLQALGYGSIGCTHCTEKGAGRSGRWLGQEKTECGLHPGYWANKLR